MNDKQILFLVAFAFAVFMATVNIVAHKPTIKSEAVKIIYKYCASHEK